MKKYILCLIGCLILMNPCESFAQEEVSPIEVDGDQVEFDIKERKVIASGNVKISKGDAVLTCDRVEFYRDTEIAHAFGHVVLTRGKERIEGKDLVFNFKTLKGDFDQPLLTAPPLYGAGERVEKIGDNHFRIHNGYVSTCDFDNPQSRIKAKTIDVYPGDVAVARGMTMKIGKASTMYWPRYTEDLQDRSSIVRITPGYKSDWGGFLLSRWRFDRSNPNFKTFVHLDWRERKDLAWGVDNEYKTGRFGEGAIKTYYMNERDIGDTRIWDDRTSPTIERERYKVEWRHRWDVDETTSIVSQFYKISDDELLKDYFESEYDRDKTPDSYVVATKGLTHGTLVAQADYRVNRYTSTVDRLPEIGYTLPSLEIFDTNLYLKNTTTASSLWQKNASPTDSYAKTKRVHFDNKISYPSKISFIEVTPFVGTRYTYYSRTKEEMMQDKVRGVFRTGIDLSTKFYRTYEAETDNWNLDINQLRHVITPSIAYEYQDNPTVMPDELDQYDAIDELDRVHKAILSVENKLQTKRDGNSVDLARLILSTEYAFQQDAELPSSFNRLKADLEVTPYKWLGFYFDSEYNPQEQDLVEMNFDLYVNDTSDIWYFRLGDRYHREEGQQLEAGVGWKINPKWAISFDQTYDVTDGKDTRNEFTIHRDLHAWLMDVSYSSKEGGGDEIFFTFRLKGFDDVALEGGTSFEGGSERPGAN